MYGVYCRSPWASSKLAVPIVRHCYGDPAWRTQVVEMKVPVLLLKEAKWYGSGGCVGITDPLTCGRKHYHKYLCSR